MVCMPALLPTCAPSASCENVLVRSATVLLTSLASLCAFVAIVFASFAAVVAFFASVATLLTSSAARSALAATVSTFCAAAVAVVATSAIFSVAASAFFSTAAAFSSTAATLTVVLWVSSTVFRVVDARAVRRFSVASCVRSWDVVPLLVSVPSIAPKLYRVAFGSTRLIVRPTQSIMRSMPCGSLVTWTRCK